jgi:hypothetical protein
VATISNAASDRATPKVGGRLINGAKDDYREEAIGMQFSSTAFGALALAFSVLILPANPAWPQTPDQLKQRAIERRAVEAVNWRMPAVNTDLMLQEMLGKTAGKVNQIVYWSRPRGKSPS